MNMLAARVCLSILILGAAAFGQHEYTASEIETGRQQYANQCNRCHGPDGDYVANADVGKGKFRRAASDEQLVELIRNGVPGTAMAAANNISEPNAKAIVAYLRSMASTAAAVAALPPGDASRGKTVYEAKGQCMNCHRISDRGSRLGPDLSQIGASRRTVELHRSLTDPNADVVPANRSFRIVTRDGAAITGRLLNQDTFTVQLLDDKDKLVSVQKSTLREFGFVSNSPMPSYRDKLSSQELADVISYLVSLKEANQ
ncbi:MAG: c-type cytochrome [Acidobacteria bacterium]|nr:c-type cytochrome [Acidobacteriota bacterium]